MQERNNQRRFFFQCFRVQCGGDKLEPADCAAQHSANKNINNGNILVEADEKAADCVETIGFFFTDVSPVINDLKFSVCCKLTSSEMRFCS